jgi:hypothetical protein
MGKFAAFQTLLARASLRNSQCEASGDDGTNDLLVSDGLRRNELQSLACLRAARRCRDKDEEPARSVVKAHA